MQNGDGTIAHAIQRGIDLLSAAGCEKPRADAEALIAEALGVDIAQLGDHASTTVAPPIAAKIARYVARRAAREPREYILNHGRFRGIDLYIDNRVIVPDPASGILVDVALRLGPGSRVHEVGTGCGAIALATAYERRDFRVTGSDISPDAIDVARANAERLNLDVTFSVEPWLPQGNYDLVVANLPYVDEDQRELQLPREYDYQPRLAVYAGTDGLAIIRELVAHLDELEPSTLVALQHAPSQTDAVRAYFADPETLGDGAPFARVTVGRLMR